MEEFRQTPPSRTPRKRFISFVGALLPRPEMLNSTPYVATLEAERLRDQEQRVLDGRVESLALQLRISEELGHISCPPTVEE